MSRKAHYWKPSGAASAPSNILVVDTETWHGDKAKVPGGELQKFRLGVAIAYRLESGRRTREQTFEFTDRESFWRLLESRLDKKRPLWVVGHNLGYDWGVLGGWGVLVSDRFRVERAAIGQGIFHVKGHLDNKPIVLSDTFNYYRTSLASIGKSYGYPKLDMPDQELPDSEMMRYCRRDVEVTALALDGLIAFVRSEGLGPWQPTIAGLSFSAFRCRFMNHKILSHDKPYVHALERAGYYGGIVDTALVGPVPFTPIHELDVCSMYPAVCQNVLPSRLKGHSRRVGPRVVKQLLDKYMLIADVDLDTKGTVYPVKLKDGTYYPRGRFRTTLPHPELVEAIKHGHVRYYHAVAWYDAEPIFRDYMLWATGLKAKFREEGNDAWATIAKYFATNLYGKTGQLTPLWVEWGTEAMERLEMKYGLIPTTLSGYADKPPTLYELEETVELSNVPESVQVRDYYGVVEARVGEFESRDSSPAIAACVTSYARCLLRRFQAIAGERQWVYTDTDSLWVSDLGRKRLEDAGCVGAETLGLLKVERTHECMIVHGPKDYETNLCRKLKGVRAKATRTEDGGWTQLQFPSPLVQIRDGMLDGVYVRTVTKHIKRKTKRCKILAGGWTRPLVFPDECPTK